MRRLLPALALLLACSSSDDPPTQPSTQPPVRPQPTGPCGQGLPTTPDPEAPVHTPRWAFAPWISKDISDTDDTYAFVDGFAQRDIPVGVVVLDSPWETSYNSLIPNPKRYHDFDKLLADLRARDVRVVLWLTAMINSTSFDLEASGDAYDGPAPNHDEASSCGFFVNEGQEYGWWKGKGGGLDFFNPKATAWWHWQLDKLLDRGVAGFKLDFGENYIRTEQMQTAAGVVSHQQYSEAYYRDFYLHGTAAKGKDEFVTMVRPYDKSYDFEGRFFARPEHAPVCWVGDNRRDWIGLQDALDEIFRSAAAGYAVLGSDIGGYLDRDDKDLTMQVPADTEVFIRWTALGAMTPFMQLHGRANATPWTVPDRQEESVAAWRYWATLHRQLVPFFYSLSEEAHAGGPTILHPQGDEASWPNDYRFLLGDAFLVAPIVGPGGKRSVALPEGTYLDWWNLAGDEIAGGQTIEANVPDISKIPLYLRQGAIVPLEVKNEATGLGDASSADALSVLVYAGPQTSRFVVHGESASPFAIEASAAGAVTITAEQAPKPLLLRVRGLASGVTLGGQPLGEAGSAAELAQKGQGFRRDQAALATWVRLPTSTTAQTVVLAP